MGSAATSLFWATYFLASVLIVPFWHVQGLNRLLTLKAVVSPEWVLPRANVSRVLPAEI